MREYYFQKLSKSTSRISTLSPIARRFQTELLDIADITLNGKRPWDITVHDNRMFVHIARNGSLGLAESYMDGWWDCDQLDVLFTKILSARLNRRLIGTAKFKLLFSAVAHLLFNFQSVSRAFQVGIRHYDIGNNLYAKLLGSSMVYSCGYWKNAEDLDQAQQQKMDLICRKLKLEPGMTLLDIGCGWGTLALYIAKHYGVKVTGITVSQEQYNLAKEKTRDYDVEILLEDYRDLTGTYDRIVSVGMFEHVGSKNYRTFFDIVSKRLDPQGIFLLHTIGQESLSKSPDPFLHKYIFPNGRIPSRKVINDTSTSLLRLEDWHNFGPDYDKTLMAWIRNFQQHWPEVKKQYGEAFYRMWRYYLHSCAGYFRSRSGQLWQLVFTLPDNTQPYESVR